MKAVVFHGIGDIRSTTSPEPKLEKPSDAIAVERGKGSAPARSPRCTRSRREQAGWGSRDVW